MSDHLTLKDTKSPYSLLKTGIPILISLVSIYALYLGFLLLRDASMPQGLNALFAIVWGVGGIAALYSLGNWIIQTLPPKAKKHLTPALFVGPAILILSWYLIIPTFRSFFLSFFNRNSTEFIGLDNYAYIFTDRTMRTAFVNNLIWMIFGTGFSLIFGLTFAILADRSRFEVVAKALIFLPMAISFVGASIIWKFIYAYRPVGENQIGLLNALITSGGGDPINWITVRPWNTLFLVIILVWLQSGYAMVILSAAIKNVPKDIIEAARIDGASEMKIIFKVVIPTIRGSLITVGTTILLITLKVYDIVYTMTNGLFGTEVLATQQYKQMFKFLNYGRGSSIAIIILVAVIPVIWFNLKQFGEREGF